MKLLWRARAVSDLAAQLAFVRAENPTAAERLKTNVERSVGLLIDFPELGRPTQRPTVRELVVPRTPYVIVYRHGRDEVVVLRLFHAKQNR